MLTYGITGGIGSGKSTVADMFRSKKIPVFDADCLARELLAPGSELTQEALGLFPGCAAGADSLDRDKLAELVFADPGARMELEDLLHPAIRREFFYRANRLPRPRPAFCVLEGALLLQSRVDFELAGLIAIFASPQVRMHRLLRRERTTAEQIRARMAAQLPECRLIQAATHLVDNGGDLTETRSQVAALLKFLAAESGGR